MYNSNSPKTLNASLNSTGSPTMDMPSQLIELRKENERLLKEMDAKEAKLSSSMRSIKMFWSPELKKERAARKTEAEKYAQLNEQFNVVSKESQVKEYSKTLFLLVV